jgi:hypothetical protein
MSSTLTCWKEIAQYLHKGVRTVQRYEQQMGLPVRRPQGRGNGVVLAFSDEIDVWMRSHFEGEAKSELEVLHKELAEVMKQNKLLRARLERAERAVTFIQLNGTADVEHWMDEAWRKRCSHAVERSTAIRLQSAELINLSRNMQELRRMQREQACSFSNPHQFTEHRTRYEDTWRHPLVIGVVCGYGRTPASASKRVPAPQN